MTVNQRSIETLSQHGQLITTKSFLTSLPDEINDNTINDVKHYFTDHVWYELLQRVYQNIQYKELFYMFFDIVNVKKCEWPVIMQQGFYNNEYDTM